MARYYFDTQDGGDVVIDEEGLEFSSLEGVKREAARSLAELARDVLPGSVRRELAIDVRDGRSRHILRTVLILVEPEIWD
jgi:hypothetical protein